MENCIFKEDKVHGLSRVVNIVFSKIFSELFRKDIKVINPKIFLMSIIIVTENDFFNVYLFPLKLETILEVALSDPEEPISIFVINQPIIENTLSLMDP